MREIKTKFTKNINIFQVICSDVSFKLPKWMGDNYVWCLNDCDRRTCYFVDDHQHRHHHHRHRHDTNFTDVTFSATSAGWIIIRLYAVRITTFLTNSFHVWLASQTLSLSLWLLFIKSIFSAAIFRHEWTFYSFQN